MSANRGFAQLIASYGGGANEGEEEIQQAEDVRTEQHEAALADDEKQQQLVKLKPARQSSQTNGRRGSLKKEDDEIEKLKKAHKQRKKVGALMTVEERSTGGIGWPVYQYYFRAMGGNPVLIFLFVIVVAGTAAKMATDLWLAWWSEDQLGLRVHYYMIVYALLGVSQCFFVFLLSFFVARFSTRGAVQLHDRSFASVSRAPLSFFDTTPLGRILHRFSKDQDCIPIDDQILTGEGFMSLADVLNHFSASSTLDIACFDRATDSIEYHPIGLDGVVYLNKQGQPRVSDRLIRFRGADKKTDVDLTTTPNHRVYAKLGRDDNNEPFMVTTATELLDKKTKFRLPYRDLHFQAAATNGVIRPSLASTSDIGQQLELSGQHEMDAFVELFGYWLGDGSLDFNGSCIVFVPVKQHDWAYLLALQRRLARVLPLADRMRKVKGGRVQLGTNYQLLAAPGVKCMYVQPEAEMRGGDEVQRRFYIYHPAWWTVFTRQYAHKYKGPKAARVAQEAALVAGGSAPRPRYSSPDAAEEEEALKHGTLQEGGDAARRVSQQFKNSRHAMSDELVEQHPPSPSTLDATTSSPRPSSRSSFGIASSPVSATARTRRISLSFSSNSTGMEIDLTEDEDEKKLPGSCIPQQQPQPDWVFKGPGPGGHYPLPDGSYISDAREWAVGADGKLVELYTTPPFEPVSATAGPAVSPPVSTLTSLDTTLPDAEDINSAKWIPYWAKKWLSMLQCRLLLRGLRFADGNQSEEDGSTDSSRGTNAPLIYTSSARFRDEILLLAIDAGYAVRFAQKTRADQLGGYVHLVTGRRRNSNDPPDADEMEDYRRMRSSVPGWVMTYSEDGHCQVCLLNTVYKVKNEAEQLLRMGKGVLRCRRCYNEVHAQCDGRRDAVLRGNELYYCTQCRAAGKTQPQHPNERPYMRAIGIKPLVARDDVEDMSVETGEMKVPERVWCVNVPHKDHLIFARHAGEKDPTTGLLKSASRPIIVGNCIDSSLSESIRSVIMLAAQICGSLVLMCVATPVFIVPLLPCMYLYYRIQVRHIGSLSTALIMLLRMLTARLSAVSRSQGNFRQSSREVKRMDSTTRSPLFAHFSETLTGLSTIRAYHREDVFIRGNEERVDGNMRAYYLVVVMQRWIGLRLETLASAVVFFSGAVIVITSFYFGLGVGLAGLSLSYAISMTTSLVFLIRQSIEAEMAMNSVERSQYYAEQIDQEQPALMPDDKRLTGGSHPSADSPWPSQGKVTFDHLSLRYRPNLPLILQDVSIEVKGGERIGIVGRTGAGQSNHITSVAGVTRAPCLTVSTCTALCVLLCRVRQVEFDDCSVSSG